MGGLSAQKYRPKVFFLIYNFESRKALTNVLFHNDLAQMDDANGCGTCSVLSFKNLNGFWIRYISDPSDVRYGAMAVLGLQCTVALLALLSQALQLCSWGLFPFGQPL